MITLVATIKAKQGKEKDLETALTTLIQKVEAEEGTLQYILHKCLNDPQKFMFYEIYTDQAALALHSTTDYFKQTMKMIFPYLDGKPEIDTFQEVNRIHKAE